MISVCLKCIFFMGIFILALTKPAMACTSLIVGKKASATGEVIVGHNEDNGSRRIVMPMYKVPRMYHEVGETIVLEDGMAVIPQVSQTWAYTWSETRANIGASFSDYFINEWGVVVCSDSCPSREDTPELTEGGIGYGIRTLIPQRAKTAREGVEIAAALLDKYGYASSGRSYQICDKDEAWMLQIVNGKHYVAQRIPDDHVAFIPNHYTISKIDFNDHDNFIVSKDLVEHAIEKGWYEPKNKGDYSDFNFSRAYRNPESYSTDRDVHPIHMLKYENADKSEELPFSFKPNHKITVNEVKNILRTHYENTEDDLTNGYKDDVIHYTAKRVVCTGTTQESSVVQIRENPDFILLWHASGRPCTSPYIPMYVGAANVPSGFGWIEPNVGMSNHFTVPSSDLDYNPSRCWWSFIDLQTIVNPQYKGCIETIQNEISSLEKAWDEQVPKIEKEAYELYHSDKAVGLKYLENYTNEQSILAVETVQGLYNRFDRYKIHITEKSVEKCKLQNTKITVNILSNSELDASVVDPTTVRAGLGYINPKQWAVGTKSELKDVKGDTEKKLVIEFNADDILNMAATCINDIWIYGKTYTNKTFVAKDLVTVK